MESLRSSSPHKYQNVSMGLDRDNSFGESWKLDPDCLGRLEDGRERAITWTFNNSLLLSHPYIPKIQGQFVDGSGATRPKKFDLPSPPPIQQSPLLFGSPTVISVAPKDRYVFAYFPAAAMSESEGLGCIWQAGSAAGLWTVKDYWPIKNKDAVVVCRWLGEPREWVRPDEHHPLRRPGLGPTLLRRFALLLVTQSHRIHMVSRLDSKHESLQLLRAPLDIAFGTLAGGPQAPDQDPSSDVPQKKCIVAAIGLAPNEDSIIIATKSCLIPQLSCPARSSGPMELPYTQTATSYLDNYAWPSWDGDNTISLCEVRIGVVYDKPTLETIPLPPIIIPSLIRDPEKPFSSAPRNFANLSLTNLLILADFIPNKVVEAQDQTDSQLGSPAEFSSEMLIIGCFVELGVGGFSSTPRSVISSWRLSKSSPKNEMIGNEMDITPSSGNVQKRPWIWKPEVTRTFINEVATFAARNPSSSEPGILVGLMDSTGIIEPGQSDSRFGQVKVLNLLLEDDERYDTVNLLCSKQVLGYECPKTFAISSNNCLLATSSGSSGLSITRLPQYIGALDPLTITNAPSPHKTNFSQLASSMALSILRNSDPSDIVRAFWVFAKDFPAEKSRGLLETASQFLTESQRPDELATNSSSLKSGNAGRLLGADAELAIIPLAIALYRTAPSSEVSARWSVGLDLLQLRHCVTSFIEANWAFKRRDYSQVELKAIPNIMVMLTFVITLCEKIVKEVTIWEAWRLCGPDSQTPDLNSKNLPQPSDTLLLLMHPVATSLLSQMLEQLSLYQSNLVQAPNLKNRVLEVIGGARVKLSEFKGVVEEIHRMNLEEYQNSPETKESLRVALMTLSASEPSLRGYLNKRSQMVNDRPNLAEKMALLLPGLDLPEASSELKDLQLKQNNLNSAAGNRAKRVCFRCGSVEMPEWLHGRQCFCGGIWISLPQPADATHAVNNSGAI